MSYSSYPFPPDQEGASKRKYYPAPPGTGGESSPVSGNPPPAGFGQRYEGNFQNYQTGGPPASFPPSFPAQGYEQGSYNAPQFGQSGGYGSYAPSSKQGGSGNKKIYISSLSYSVNDDDLAKAFEKFGPVVSARVGTDPQGKSKGFGFVEFESDDDVAKALKANGMEIDGRSVKIDIAQNNERGSGSGGRGDFRPKNESFQKDHFPASKTLYVGNLSFSTDKDSLRAAFDGFGGVQDTRVVVDRETGKSRGFGYVEFSDAESAQLAFDAMRDTEIEGRRVKVNYAGERNQNGGDGPGRGGFGGGRGGGRGGFGGGRGGGGGGRGYGNDYDDSRDTRRDRGFREGDRDGQRGGERDGYRGGGSDGYRGGGDGYRDSRDSGRDSREYSREREGGDRDRGYRDRGDRDRGDRNRSGDRY